MRHAKKQNVTVIKLNTMSIPLYAAPQGSMFKGAGSSMFKGLRYGVITPTIFGYNQIKGSRPKSAACCAPGEFSRLRAFYPTIWKYPLRSELIKKYSYGAVSDRGPYSCCDNTPAVP